MEKKGFDFSAFLDHLSASDVIYAVVILLAGYLLAKVAKHAVVKATKKSANPLWSKLAFYGVLFPFVITALHQLGFQLGMLLGITGVLTLAISFASQTSMSNVVSGLFLRFEKPFKKGDWVRIGNEEGAIYSQDLVSVKLKAADNSIVRIPNEMLFKSTVRNMTYMSQRRVDIMVGVAYDTDLAKAETVLLTLAKAAPQSLDSPEAAVFINAFADSCINMTLSVWCKKADYKIFKSELHAAIKTAFEKAKIEIPFPRLVVEKA